MNDNTADSLNIRLKVFMDFTGLNNSQFADKCGLPRPSFSQIITGRNQKVSDKVLTQIHNAFPELNILWLMFGEGEMVKPRVADKEGGENAKSEGEGSDSASPKSYHTEDDWDEFPFADENSSNDNRKIRYDVHEDVKNPVLANVISPDSDNKGADIERLTSLMAAKISGDLKQDLQKSPRKVVRITIFYDDNSYEVFNPSSSE